MKQAELTPSARRPYTFTTPSDITPVETLNCESGTPQGIADLDSRPDPHDPAGDGHRQAHGPRHILRRSVPHLATRSLVRVE